MFEDRLIIIDGYNLILRSPHLKPGKDRTLAEARDKLVNLLSWTIGSGKARFLVIFDGADGPHHSERSGNVEVRYSRPPQKADDLIRAVIEELYGKVERLTVVTSDIEIARHARALGADVSLSDLFLASALGPQSSQESEKPTTLSKKELDEWAEIFTRRRGNGAADDDEDLE
jgi:predicted RNA-binding protein with PIN domain